MTESRVVLPGGFVTRVVRIGDTVRRSPGERAEFVHQVLEWLDQHGWSGAPRYLGTDPEGLEILEFLPGHVAWEPDQPAQVRDERSLVAAARLVREFHDLTAGTPLAADQEVVCHNDLSPKNTVYRDADGSGLRPVAFIDWDIAAPGARVHDLAHLCWQFIGLGPQLDDVDQAGRRMSLICAAYDLSSTDRGRLVETVLWWQDRCWRGIEAAAAAGVPAMIRLRESGAAADVRAQQAWVRAHRVALEAAL